MNVLEKIVNKFVIYLMNSNNLLINVCNTLTNESIQIISDYFEVHDKNHRGKIRLPASILIIKFMPDLQSPVDGKAECKI
jgi:hypothetical protein